jgi:hypothetical protein
VLLDVENLEVEKITLEIDNLRAHISVLAELANLLNLSVGADVQLGRVKLEIDGVRAQALLKVRLENVRVILVKALETLGEHPEILENLAQTLTALLREALQDASSALGDVLEGLDVGDTVDEVLKGKLEEISSDLEGPWSIREAGQGASCPEEQTAEARLLEGPPTTPSRASEADGRAWGGWRLRRLPGARPRSWGWSSQGWKVRAQEGVSR